MEAMELIKSRRTIRNFKPDPVPQEVLDQVFEAGTWAPSHGNAQPWEFVVVGPDARARLLGMLQMKVDQMLAEPDVPEPRRQNLLSLRDDFGGAPYMVAVVARPPEDDLQKLENLTTVGAAVQNMCLAAWDQGVGAVWLSVGSAPPARSILQVEEGATVVALLAMGYPESVPEAPPREPASSRTREIP
jgi:nitroreductase